MVKRAMGAGIVALLTMAATGQETATVKSRTLKGHRLNELAAWQLVDDPVFKVFATDTTGNVFCFAADSLKPLWEISLGQDALTAPVLGDFMGNGAPILAFGSINGTVYFVWPGSGELLAEHHTDFSFVTAPSIAAQPAGDSLILADAAGFVAGFALTADGLVRETFRIDAETTDAVAVSIAGAMTHPPSTADLNHDGWPEILLMSETGLVQLLSLSPDPTATPERFLYRIPQNTVASTVAAMGPLQESGDPIFGFGVGSTLHFFKWDPAAGQKAIQPYVRTSAYGNSLGHLLLGEVNSDPSPDLVSTANSTVAARYLGNDLAGEKTLLDIDPNQLSTQHPPFSPAIPLTLRNGEKAVVAVDSEGVAFVWQPLDQNMTPKRIADVPVPTTFTPAGNLTGNGQLTMIVWNETEFTLSSVALPVDLPPVTEAAPVLTLGVNYSRNGQWGQSWQKNFDNRKTRAKAALQRAKSQWTSSEDTVSTTDSISQIAGIAPADPLAEGLKYGPDRRSLSTGLILPAGIIVLLGLAGGTIYFISKNKRRRA